MFVRTCLCVRVHKLMCVCACARMLVHECVWSCVHVHVPTCLPCTVCQLEEERKHTCLLSSTAVSLLMCMSANHLWISVANGPWLLPLSQPARDRSESWWLHKQTLPVFSSLFNIMLLLSSEANMQGNRRLLVLLVLYPSRIRKCVSVQLFQCWKKRVLLS